MIDRSAATWARPVQENKLNGLDNKPIKTTKKPPPRSINENLPPCYFTSIFIGSKGSSKTYSLIKLLKIMRNTPYMTMKDIN
jgi:hypothetical protein